MAMLMSAYTHEGALSSAATTTNGAATTNGSKVLSLRWAFTLAL
jgi:hypothetical protein